MGRFREAVSEYRKDISDKILLMFAVFFGVNTSNVLYLCTIWKDIPYGISLDELAYKFSKNIKDILINKTYIIDKNIVSSSIVNLFEEFMGSNEKYDEKSLLALMVFKEMIDSGFLSMDEMKKISLKIKEVYERLGSDDYILSVKRKYGVSFVVLNKEKEEIIVDDEAKAILEIDLGKIMDEIKRISQG